MPEERTVYKVHLPAYHISCQVDYMCVKNLQQLFLPLRLLKSSEHKAIPHHQRSFHQHPVRGQKRQLLVLTHGRQFIFQRHFLVDISAAKQIKEEESL